MFGTLRLALAVLVASSHVGSERLGIGPMIGVGAAAVMVFFLVSGHAMSGLETRLGFGGPDGSATRFLGDRLARLWPQYAVWVVLAAIAADFGRWPAFTRGDAQLGAGTLLANLSILPLTFSWILPFEAPIGLVPQGWSLGTELVFYGVFPLLVRRRRCCAALAGISAVVFGLAGFGVVPTVPFGYVMPFGTFCFFALGHAVFRRDRLIAGTIAVALGVVACALFGAGRLGFLVNGWQLGGVALGVPALLAAERFRVVPRAVDRAFGDASFGTYLSHNLVISLLGTRIGAWWMLPVVPAVSAITGWAGAVAIDRPVGAMRRRWRVAGAER